MIQSLTYGTRYVGSTENIIERLHEHNLGKCRYTNSRRPWRLVYKEKYLTRAEAMKREKFLKFMNNQNQGKKLTVFLVDGEPDGVRTIEIGGWNGIGLMFPRNKLKEMGGNEVIKKPGIYFLFGSESEDSLVTSAYIGESDNLFDRLDSHNHDKKKDFWYTTIVFASSDYNFTKTHAKYLESRCATIAYEVQHSGYIIKNGKESLPPHFPPVDIPAMEEFVKNINLILTTIGYPILHKTELKNESDFKNPLFYCQSKDPKIKGIARMTNEGFILYKGSTIAVDHSPAVADHNNRIINKLLEGGIIKKEGGTYVFKKDYIFKSKPSSSASLILGYAVNGWDVWKTIDGKTLDEIYRHRT